MKRLFLLRHAKAGFHPEDKSRPLAQRGIRDATWLGQYIKDTGLIPDYILCSSAVRARETGGYLLKNRKDKPQISFQDNLYLAPAGHLYDELKSLGPAINNVMIIGHNPGLSALFQNLATDPPTDSRSLKYPTCMVAILDFDILDWSQLKSCTGQVFDLIIPSDRIEDKP
ncbi:MAG: histidine phosphatase family protein [Emcibacter sp.]|nr:histidine phosphatase family protein [Emcibacter sp.]